MVLISFDWSTRSGSKDTVAFSEAKLTEAWSTPGSLLRPFSMVAAQVAQDMPPTLMMTFLPPAGAPSGAPCGAVSVFTVSSSIPSTLPLLYYIL